MDANSELRSMIFCAIHLPPLPAIVSWVEEDGSAVLDNEATESSHGIMGGIMEWTAMASNEVSNRKRLLEQTALMRKFKEELLAMDLDECKDEALYDFYRRHTREWICVYASMGNTLRIRPLDYIVNNDKIHKNMQGYSRAQQRLFTGQSPTIDTNMPYACLMRECAKWTKQSLAAKTDTVETLDVQDMFTKNDVVQPSGGTEGSARNV